MSTSKLKGIGIKDWPKDPGGWLFNVNDINRTGFWEGRAMKTCFWLSLLYVFVTFGTIFVYAIFGIRLSCLRSWRLLLALAIGVFVSAGPPYFYWLEAKAFDRWLILKTDDADLQKGWRETYKLNADNGRAFWVAMLAVYSAMLFFTK